MRHNRTYGAIARRLIRTFPEFRDLEDSEVRIAYLSSHEEKQKAGKKRLKQVGTVELPQEAFMAILSMDKK